MSYPIVSSLRGLLARLDPTGGGGLVWALAVLLVLGMWGYRVRHAGNDALGFALTGVGPARGRFRHPRPARLRPGMALVAVPARVDGFIGGNSYVWVSLALLFAAPPAGRRRATPGRR